MGLGGLEIALVDDVEVVRQVFGDLLEAIPGVGKVHRLSSLAQLERVILAHRPDVVFMDEVLPGENPVEFARSGRLQGVRTYWVTGFSEAPIPPEIQTRVSKPSLDSWDADLKRFQALIQG